jgi:hypothetical protein
LSAAKESREARRLFDQEGDNGRTGAFTALAAAWMFIVLFKEPLAESLQVPTMAPAGARDEIRREIHILHAAGDRDVDIAERNLLRRRHDRLGGQIRLNAMS